MRSFAMIFLLVAGACAEPDADMSDGEAEAAPEQPLGKADAATFAGLYATSTTSLRSGDVPSLQLLDTGGYVRQRCYRTNCALQVAETDHYDTYTSTTGKTYVRFYSFHGEWNATHDEHGQIPTIADVYEIRQTATTIRLRKSYTSRWLTLRKTTAESQCLADGGTWDGAGCACPGDLGWSDDGYVAFVPGLGGCATIPGAGEGECDDTDGFYTDDDATLVATYCLCEHGTYLTNSGCAPL